jgi:hypothetical protein
MTDEAAKPAPHNALLIRMAIGLGQGIALYALAQAHGRLVPVAQGGLQYLAWLAPIVALGAYGATRARTLLIWVGTAALIAVGLVATKPMYATARTPTAGALHRWRSSWPRHCSSFTT